MALCHEAALNTWDRVEDVGKITESFIKVLQGSKETLTYLFIYLQRFTSAVNRIIQNSRARQTIESLAFENNNSQFKRASRPLKVRSSLINEWVRIRVNIDSVNHDIPCIGEVITRGIRKNYNVRCFNCGKQHHLKRLSRNNVF